MCDNDTVLSQHAYAEYFDYVSFLGSWLNSKHLAENEIKSFEEYF